MNSDSALRTAADYVHLLQGTLHRLDLAAVQRMARYLETARDDGRTIYLAGNGGSAATASHCANDLSKATRRSGAKPVRAVALNDHVPWLTALANDEGYERVFAGQVEALVRPHDVLVVFSASGNSPNLVQAVLAAKERRALTLGCLGFDGGVLKELVDDCVWVPTERGAYGPAEDVHLIVCHIVTTLLARTAASAAVHARSGGAAAGD